MSWFTTFDQRNIPSKLYPTFIETIPEQTGKVVVITGTTSGTGYVAALTSARKGATVCLLNRKSERAEAALETLQKSSGAEKGKFISIDCDLMSFESVKNAANQVKEKFPEGIDVLANNAGIMMFDETATKDGYDCQMQTNHFSHFLLTNELFSLLKKKSLISGEARVVNHSSVARKDGKFESKYYEKLTAPGSLGGNGTTAKVARYSETKLANAIFTNALQDKLTEKGLKIKAYCAHPGLAATNLQVTTAKNSDSGFMTCLLNILFSWGIAGSPQSQEDGTIGLLKCMYEPNLPTGGVYGPANNTWSAGPAIHNYPDTQGKLAEIKENKEKIWTLSETACGGVFNIE